MQASAEKIIAFAVTGHFHKIVLSLKEITPLTYV
jgi:hypothetical protein